MSSSTTTSIKIYIARYLVVIFVVVLASAIVSYLFYKHDYEKLQLDEQHKNLMQTATSIGRLIQFYQSVVDAIARQHVVVDLLQFGTSDQALEWALGMQKLVPDSIGMALFEPTGTVRGSLSELRLNDQCLMDMQGRIQGRPVPQPPVHRKIQALAHFDIVSAVMDSNDAIGLVFASFSIKTIENMLNELLGSHQQLKVIAPDGYVIAMAGNLDSNTNNSVYTEVFAIQGTDWVLESIFVPEKTAFVLTALSISNIVIFLLLTLVFVVAMSRFFKIIIADFGIISNMMQHIQDNSFERQHLRPAHLKETEGVIKYMQFLATELVLHQKRIHDASITDELTGLHNRRVLNEEIAHCLERVKQGEPVALVILDLDNFKQINDAAGHDIGDQILVALAEVIMERCLKNDICVRVGGDEFIAILRGYNQKQVNEWYLSVLNDFQKNTYAFREKLGAGFSCGISAGFTMFRPEDDRSSLLKRADLALYTAKDKGRCNIQYGK